jgi:cell wall-associated NlpC family hydrolase
MSAPSYFDNLAAAEKLRVEALSWAGTPFAQFYPQEWEAAKEAGIAAGMPPEAFTPKGPGGGIDCIGLTGKIFANCGATKDYIFPREPADYQTSLDGEKVLDWLRGKALDPLSPEIAALFTELEIPEAVTDPKAATPRDVFKPGDLLVMRHGSLFHLPIIYDNDLHLVNCLPRLGVTYGTIQDSTFLVHHGPDGPSRRLVAVFRLKPR